jgi:hypothetical protein
MDHNEDILIVDYIISVLLTTFLMIILLHTFPHGLAITPDVQSSVCSR